VRKYKNNKEGYEEILEMKPYTIVLYGSLRNKAFTILQGERNKSTTS